MYCAAHEPSRPSGYTEVASARWTAATNASGPCALKAASAWRLCAAR